MSLTNRIRGSAQAVFVNNSQDARVKLPSSLLISRSLAEATPSLARPHYLALLHIFDTATGRAVRRWCVVLSVTCSKLHPAAAQIAVVFCALLRLCSSRVWTSRAVWNALEMWVKAKSEVPLWCGAALHDAAALCHAAFDGGRGDSRQEPSVKNADLEGSHWEIWLDEVAVQAECPLPLPVA